MALSSELKKIKKLYGEDLMHYCRETFPTILEDEGALIEILTSTFEPNSKDLYKDISDIAYGNSVIDDFKALVFSKYLEKINSAKDEETELIETRSPYELLNLAGYDLYECKTNEDIQKFKKYYAEKEELCTFRDNRLKKAIVFFAVKKDVDGIKREDFPNPSRDDEYGTSVISIQFSIHGPCTISIKNRYNHTVLNPDATLGNNLELIIKGLTQSFKTLLKERGLELDSSNVERTRIPGHVVASDGKFYKFNFEQNGVYYCPGNIIIDGGRIIRLEPEKQILVDNFIIDKEKKTISLYDTSSKDSFIDYFKDIEKITVEKNKNDNLKTISVKIKNEEEPVQIVINRNNNIVEYINNSVKEIGNDFLSECKRVKRIELGNVVKIGDCFQIYNQNLEELSAKKLKQVGDECLQHSMSLNIINTPELKKVGNSFAKFNSYIDNINFPNLIEVGDDFFYYNTCAHNISIPKLEKIGKCFFNSNCALLKLDAPSLIEVGRDFLPSNTFLKELNTPKLQRAGDDFLFANHDLKEYIAPELVEVGDYFLGQNIDLKRIVFPKLKKTGDNFISKNNKLEEISIPRLVKCKDNFLQNSYATYIRCLNSIDRKNISELSRDLDLQISEVSMGRKIIESIKNFFHIHSDNQR